MDKDRNEVDSSLIVNFEASNDKIIPPFYLGISIDIENNTFIIYIREDVKKYVKF